MSGKRECIRLGADQHAFRAELLGRLNELTAEYGGGVHTVGSHQATRADFFSDLDVWIENPDADNDAVIARRHELLGMAGRCLFSWERPRFAPLKGMHTVAVYGDVGMKAPLELNVFQAPRSVTRAIYNSFVRPAAPLPAGYDILATLPWQSGEDPAEPTAKLHHTLLVTTWALKAMHRGGPIKPNIKWMQERYTGAAAYVPCLPPLTEVGLTPRGHVEEVLANVAGATEAPGLHEAVQRLRFVADVALNGNEDRQRSSELEACVI